MNWTRIAYAALILALGLTSPALAQGRIGVASIVKNKVSGTVGGQTRVIGSGA